MPRSEHCLVICVSLRKCVSKRGWRERRSPILALSHTHLRPSPQRQVSSPMTIVLNLAQRAHQVGVRAEIRNGNK
jgi:hypothetical protein